MKKTVLLLMTLSIIFVSAEAKSKKVKQTSVLPVNEKVLTNEVDSMSYALGLNVGADFLKNIAGIPGGKSNIDLIIKGFTTAMKADSALMTSEFAIEYFKGFITKVQKADVEIKKSEGEKFLADNMSQDGVNVTPSGLQYKVLVAADGKKPSAQDTVKVHYHGTLVNGKVFDSSVNRGEPIEFPLNQVIKGWTEGVQLMSIGSKFKFFIPHNLGYGQQGAGEVIAPFSTLIFEVELLDIKPFIEPKSEVAPEAVPAKVKKAVKKK